MSDTHVAEKANWDGNFEKPNNTGKKAVYMKFDGPGDYQVRFLGSFVKFLRHNDPFERARVITHPSYKDQDPAWAAGFVPRETYAIHVLDRRDGIIKILEKGNSIFKHLGKYKKLTNVDPSGKTAPDFIISVEWPGGNKMQAKYTVTPMPTSSELTAGEIDNFKKNLVKLDEMYKSTSLEKIAELWANVPAERRVYKNKWDNDKPSANPRVAQAQAVVAAPIVERNAPAAAEVSADDLFAGDSNSDF